MHLAYVMPRMKFDEFRPPLSFPHMRVQFL